MKQTSLFFLIFFCFQSLLTAQLRVQSSGDTMLLRKQLLGKDIEIKNLTINGSVEQVGVFSDPIGIIGLRNGIILASGDVKLAEGPNNDGKTSTTFDDLASDSLLDVISSSLGVSYHDAMIVEFDFVAKGNVVSFNYVFASEEYTEDDEEYPDFFGFWVTGPDYPKPVNFATLPNSTVEVSTGSINDRVNTQYFNGNGEGNTPIFNPYLGFDGYTDVLKAEINVIPCETYHLKLQIADARDKLKDSGVFIETQSLKSTLKPIFSAEFESSRNSMFEGCADVEVIVNQENNSNKPIVYDLTFSGTADFTDVSQLPDSIQIDPNSSKNSFRISAFVDEPEGVENLVIGLKPRCITGSVLETISIPIDDYIRKKIPDYSFCSDSIYQVKVFNDQTDKVQYESNPSLSCFSCTQPFVSFNKEDTVDYVFTDIETGCIHSDSFAITTFIPFVEFSVDTSSYYSVLDLFGTIDSSNMHRFFWTFDQDYYFGNKVSHQINVNKNQGQCIKIRLVSFEDSLHCQSSIDTIFCANSELNIPNVITPNFDNINDFFAPKGIVSGFWSLEIYNRNGKRVYFSDRYQFDFNAKDISDGTYYYYLENQNKDRHYKGWLQIIR